MEIVEKIQIIRNWLEKNGAKPEHLKEFDKMAKEYLEGKRKDIPLWKILKISD